MTGKSDQFDSLLPDTPAEAPKPPAELASFVDDSAGCLDVDLTLSIESLTPREVKFLSEYIEHGVIGRAAKAAGYATGNPVKQSFRLARAVDAVQRSLAKKFSYDTTAAFRDLDEAMQFARDNGAAMALVRAIEIKMKATGQIDAQRITGKIQHDHTHTIEDTRSDAELLAHADALAKRLGLHSTKADALDGEFNEVPASE